MSITIRDIEKETGISRSMVERILNNKRTIDDNKRKTVLEAVQRLKYSPLDNIPLLNKVKTHSLGVVSHISNTIHSQFYNKFVNAVKNLSAESGYDCLLYSERDIIRKTTIDFHKGRQNFNCDGLIFFCPYQYEKYTAILRSWEIPCVLVRRHTKVEGVATINNNDAESIIELVDHLYKAGHRVMAFIGGRRLSEQTDERRQGYREGLRRHGLAREERLELEITSTAGFTDHYEQLMEPPNRPTALVCFDDTIALDVMRELRKHGVKVPDEVAVTGFNDDGTGELVHPALTTVRINTDSIAQMACKVLIDRLMQGDVTGMDLTIRNELVVRESCGSKKTRISVKTH